MRLPQMTVLMLVILIAIATFEATGTVDPQNANPTFFNSSLNSPSAGNSTIWMGFNANDIWTAIFNPNNFATSAFIAAIIIFIGSVLAVTFGAGLLRITTSDTTNFSPLIYALFLFGSIPVAMLYTFLQKELSSYMCGPGLGACYMPTMISILFAGTLLINWIFACLQVWRTGFTST